MTTEIMLIVQNPRKLFTTDVAQGNTSRNQETIGRIVKPIYSKCRALFATTGTKLNLKLKARLSKHRKCKSVTNPKVYQSRPNANGEPLLVKKIKGVARAIQNYPPVVGT